MPAALAARADEVLRKRGVDPNSYHHAVLLGDTTDPIANEFLANKWEYADKRDL